MRQMKAQDRVGDVNARGGSLTSFRQSVANADVSPIGEDGGDKMGNKEIQSGRAYGEAGTSVPRERVRSKSPSRHTEEEGPG